MPIKPKQRSKPVPKEKPKEEKKTPEERPWIVIHQKMSKLKEGIVEFPELNQLRKYYDVLGVRSQQRTVSQNYDRSVHFVYLVSKD